MKLPRTEMLEIRVTRKGTAIEAQWIGELIRCEDCHFFDIRREGRCEKSGLRVSGEDYCSKARAK